MALNFLSQTVRQVHRATALGLRADHDELFATPATNDVGLAGVFTQNRGDGNEYLIAGLMTVGVIDGLEMVDIQHDDAEWLAEAIGAHDLLLQHRINFQAVEYAGECVGNRQALQRFVQRGQLAIP